MALTVGAYVGSYRLLSLIMTGQSSQVWEVLHDARQQRFALKTMLEDHRTNRTELGYLRNEYLVGRTLDHPCLLKYYELGSHHRDLYLVMELFKAPNLKYLLLRERERLVRNMHAIVLGAAEGLAYFHRQGWVHRDVKPDNFLFGGEGRVKLIDFALAQRPKGVLGRLFARKTQIQGTRSYLSPEQIRGRPVDAQSDIYSFGCMLHELVAGKPPYTGSNTNELLGKHLRAAVPSLEAACKDVSPRFADLVRRMLAKQPAARPTSMDDVLTELRTLSIYKRAASASVAKRDQEEESS